MAEHFEGQAREYVERIEGFEKLNQEQKDALVDLMIEVNKFEAKSSQSALAQSFIHAQTNATWKDKLKEGAKSISEFIEFFVVFGKLIFAKEKLGATNTSILQKVIQENPNTFLTIGKYILENYLGTILTKNVDSNDPRKAKINAEIQKFVSNNKGDIEKLILSNEINDIIKELEIMLVFSGKLTPENTTLNSRYAKKPPEEITFQEFTSSLHRTYNKPSVSPILSKFFIAYRTGEFPTLKEYAEGKTSEKVSLEYQRFVSDIAMQKAFIDMIGIPSLGTSITRIGESLHKIMQLDGVGGFWSRNGMSAAKKRALIEAEADIISEEIKKITLGITHELKRFLRENQDVWQYFLDNGFVVGKPDSRTGEVNVMIKVFGDGFIAGNRKIHAKELNSDAVIDAFFSEEVISLFIENFFIDMFRVGGIWRGLKKFEHNTEIQTIFRAHGVKNTHRFPLNLSTRPAIEHKEITEMFAVLMLSINNGQGTGTQMRSASEPIKAYFEAKRLAKAR